MTVSLLISCTKEKEGPAPSITPVGSSDSYTLDISMIKIDQAGLDPFVVVLNLKKNGAPLSGASLSLTVPKGTISSITDNGNGTYAFTVTPSETVAYPVTISSNGVSITRVAIVVNSNLAGTGQPMEVPGEYVNTQGYEDGATITPDGEYLFVQYGPVYFSGLLNFTTICSDGGLTVGHNLNDCLPRADSGPVFNTVGPYDNYQRPNFPMPISMLGNLFILMT